MRIGITGAGHSGIAAARAAATAGASVTIFSDEELLPYFRPKVVALAFGVEDDSSLPMRPAEWYRDQGIELRLETPVQRLDTEKRRLMAGDEWHDFDTIILAAGAKPTPLPFAHRAPARVLPLWDVHQSHRIREILPHVHNLLVVGGGITGVETAVYATEHGIDTHVIEKMDRLMPLQFGSRAAGVLHHVLNSLNITTHTSTVIEDIESGGETLVAHMDNGEKIKTDLIITAIGGCPPLELYREAGLDVESRVCIDASMHTSAEGIFACGDVAQLNSHAVSNVQYATQQGSMAGNNAVAWLKHESLEEQSDVAVPLSFKYGDFQLHAAGDLPASEDEEIPLQQETTETYCRAVVRNGLLCGVQMVGTAANFRKLAKKLGTDWTCVEIGTS